VEVNDVSDRDITDGGADRNGTGADRTPARVRDTVARATQLLRQHTDAGWSAIEDNVLSRALNAFRPSSPVRGRHDLGDFFLASDVVVGGLRRVIDDVPGAAAQRITCSTADDDVLDAVTIELIAAYGAPLLVLAGRVHSVARDCLVDLLGALAPAAEQIHTHVHIGDVSNDPRIVI
jgi:hypothetical protein